MRRVETLSNNKSFWKDTVGLPIGGVGVLLIVLLIVGAVGVSATMKTIDSQEVGVLKIWEKASSTLEPGLHFLNPIGTSVVRISTQIQHVVRESESAASFDQQEVWTTVEVNYRIDSRYAVNYYNDFGKNGVVTVINPTIDESLKAITAKYRAPELTQRREEVKSDLHALVADRFSKYHLILVDISITDFQFGEEYKTSIEEKSTAEQNALKAQNELRQTQFDQMKRVVEAQATANATMARADADAYNLRVTSEAEAIATLVKAEADAKAIKLMQEQLQTSPAYIQTLWIEAWKSGGAQIPSIVLNDDTEMFYNLGDLSTITGE